ncbi:MAG: TIGR00725 family protein [Desulfobacteraceae bacterium]
MKRSVIIGVMGGGSVSKEALQTAYDLGGRIAEQGWILLNGGRNAGIMAASAKGAAESGGVTVGILPDAQPSASAPHIQIPICTGMGSARNMINVLSSDVVVACPGGTGTISEIALALKHGKTVITVDFSTGELFASYRKQGRLVEVRTPHEAILKIKKIL